MIGHPDKLFNLFHFNVLIKKSTYYTKYSKHNLLDIDQGSSNRWPTDKFYLTHSQEKKSKISNKIH